MALKKKPKCLNINFNFSDDSDDDNNDNKSSNVQTKHVLKELKAESNCDEDLCLLLAADNIIVASDHPRKRELSSLSEDIGRPITESTLLSSCDIDNTMYLTALEDNLNTLHNTFSAEDKNSCAENDTNTRKLFSSENRKVAKRKDACERDKENECLISDKTKMRPWESPKKSAYYHLKRDLEWGTIQVSPLKETKLLTKNRLLEGDVCSTPGSVECNERGVKSVASLQKKLPILHTQIETSFSDSMDEKASHKHHESILGSFVEVQDASIQTNFIVEDSKDLQQDIDYDCNKLASDSEHAVKPYSQLSTSAHQLSSSKECEQSSDLSVRSIDTDVIQDGSLPIELSSYEVQDVSVQTSIDKADLEPFLMDNTHSLSSVAYESTEEHNVHIFGKPEMKAHFQNNKKMSNNVKRTLDMDSANGYCRYLDKGNTDCETDISDTKHYETVYENVDMECHRGTVTSSLRHEEEDEEQNSFHTEQDAFNHTTTRENQNSVSENQTLKSDLIKQSFETGLGRTYNFTSNLRKASIGKCVDHKITCEDLSSNNDDAEKSCDILVAASDNENDGGEDNLHKGRGEYAVEEKIDESGSSMLDFDEDNGIMHCDAGINPGSSHSAENIAVKGIGSKHNIRSTDQKCERIVTSKGNTDHAEGTIGIEKEIMFDKRSQGDVRAEHRKEGPKPVNNDRFCTDVSRHRSQRKDSESSDDDSNFENFLSKLKSSSKSQKPSKETLPLSEFIVEDEDDSSADKDNDDDDEMFYIRINNELKSERRNPPSFKQAAVDNIPFKTPWARPFETPARHVKNEDFKTPRIKRSELLPTTCPRPSFGGFGLDDDAYFLKSLTADLADYKRQTDAARFIKHFKKTKADLTQRLFKIFNYTIFQDKLPENFVIEWSSRLTTTGGYFKYKGTPSNFTAKVNLSLKVCDSPERVRDVLAHELCHAAVQLINGVNENHGRFWKSWAQKINRTFPFMPVIARCHNYVIAAKYTYQCVNCKFRVSRHSKSLDTDRKVCDFCHGKFELYLTKELNSSNEGCKTPVIPQTPRTPNKFALFVKECYSEVRKRDAGLRHGDVMRILSQEFAEKNKICD